MMLKQPSSPVNHVTYSEEDFNIIIPTRAERPKFITYNNLGPLKNRVIMVYDRWHNVCKALNYGASISKANILFFTDDDAIIPPEKILDIVKLVKKDTAVVFERQDPFGLAITKDDFIKLGGFDERFLCPRMPAYAFDTEFEKRLESKKFRIIKYPLSGVIHYGGKRPAFSFKSFVAEWNLTLVVIRYEKDLIKLIRYFFVQPLFSLRYIHILAFIFWQIYCRIKRRRSAWHVD